DAGCDAESRQLATFDPWPMFGGGPADVFLVDGARPSLRRCQPKRAIAMSMICRLCALTTGQIAAFCTDPELASDFAEISDGDLTAARLETAFARIPLQFESSIWRTGAN